MKIESVSFSELSDEDLREWRAIANEQSLINPLNDPDYFRSLSQSGFEIHVLISREAPLLVYWPYEREGAKGMRPPAMKLSDCSQLVVSPGSSFEPSKFLRSVGHSYYEFDHLFEPTSFDAQRFSYYVDPCFLMQLDNGFDSYLLDLADKGSRIKQEAKRKQNKLEREVGAVRWEPASLDPQHLQILLDWKTKQLDQQKFDHTFREDKTRRFMENHLAIDSSFCQGKLSILYAGSEIAAMHYGSWGPKAINSWLPAVNPEFGKYSPALILYLKMAQFASNNHIRTIILGRGENQTKIRLANATVTNYVGRIPSGILGHARNWGMKGLYRLLRSGWGKYLREKARKTRK